MLTLSRTLKALASAAVLTVAVSSTAQAGDFVGLDVIAGDLYSVDTGANSATNLGAIVGAPPFGFAHIDRGPVGGLYATAPGLLNGYTIYSIDQSTLSASSVVSAATNSSGNVGMAVDPSGNSAWVAGFVQLSLIVKIQEINLTTGVLTEHGSLGGNFWGLAFDSSGDLFTTTQGSQYPQLIKVDKVNAANSVAVGNEMNGVDMSMGLDLCSDAGSGSIHVFSRATATLFSVNTTTGQATQLSNLTGAGTIRSIAEDNSCALIVKFGQGCPGAGSFVPELTASGCPFLGSQISIEISKGLGGATSLMLFGLGQGSIPMGGGCNLLLSPLLPAPQLFLPLGGSGPGAGSLTLPTVIPTTLPTITFTLQVFVFDPNTVIGGSASNGLKLTIQ